VYDAVLALPEWLGLAGLRKRLFAGLEGRVLEIGAGTGANADYLANAELLVETDPEVGLLRRAGTRSVRTSRRRTRVVARAEALPFPDATFDATIATLVLCSVRDPALALRELARVTSAGGRLRILEHVRSARPLVAWLQAAITPSWSRVAGGCHLDRDPDDDLLGSGWVLTARRSHLGGLLIGEAARLAAVGEGTLTRMRDAPRRGSL
jgi:SAM-dependent methyltransferase